MNRRCLRFLPGPFLAGSALLMLCWALAACTPLLHPSAERTPDQDSAERQILVTLRLPPPHFRPDSNYAGNYESRFGRDAWRRIAAALADEHRLQLIAEWPIPALGVDCFVMAFAEGESAARIAQRLAADPRVEAVQSMNVFRVLGHNDPLYPLQPSAKLWHLAEMHEFVTGRNVLIAEVDTGIDLDHPDLRGQISVARNFVDDGPYPAEVHGTAVAGIIAARADDGVGIAGVAPHAKLLALRACWQAAGDRGAALCNSFTLAKALQFALDRRAQVINLSLGGPPDRLLQRLLDVALAQGVTIVSASDPGRSDGGFPASHAGVLAVAGDDTQILRGEVLLAPGRDIPTTLPGGRWSLVSGSSFAAAHVSGVAALLRELNPRILPAQVRDALAPASKAGLLADRPVMIDACAAIARATRAFACVSTTEARSVSSR